jgi:hypothetical protein
MYTVRGAVLDELPLVAFITTGVFRVGNVVVMRKLTDVLPDGTFTDFGTWAHTVELERLTKTPAEGATLESVTVPVEEYPPHVALGERESPFTS